MPTSAYDSAITTTMRRGGKWRGKPPIRGERKRAARKVERQNRRKGRH